MRRARRGTLAACGTDHIDLYHYHRPDGVTPIADTLGALDELGATARCATIGCSNVDAAQLREAAARRAAPVRSVQNEYSLIQRDAEADVLPSRARARDRLHPVFPARSGLLTGKYRRGEPEPAGTRLGDAARAH